MQSDFTELRSRLRFRLEDLSHRLELAGRAANNDAYDANQVLALAGDSAAAANAALNEYDEIDYEGFHQDQIRIIRWCLEELRVLGIAKDAPPSGQFSAREILAAIPEALCQHIAAIWGSIAEDERLQEARERDQSDLATAIRGKVFLEYFRRMPGKGCMRAFSPIECDVTYAPAGGKKVRWIEYRIFQYGYSLWAVSKTYCRQAVNVKPETTFEIIDRALAASLLLTHSDELNVEDMVWLKQLTSDPAGAKQEERPSISWNRKLGELTVDGQVARRIARPKQATNVVKILDAFQEDGWPVHIDSPFEPDEAGRTKLRETISQLNVKLSTIKFEADGTGEGVRFRPLRSSELTGEASTIASDPN